MRKLKLFLMACALMGAGQAWAQTDVTSTYITNADFASIDGWTQDHPTQYWSLGNGLIGTYAVANDKTSTTDDTHLATEYCLGMQCRWATNYVNFSQTTETVTLPAGAYTITYDVENTNTSTTSDTYNNLFYVKVGETIHSDNFTEWMTGSSNWTTHTISFSLEEDTETTLTLSFGYGLKDGDAHNFGSSNTPHLYVSHLKIEYAGIVRPEAVSIDETLTLTLGGTATLTPSYTPSDANTDTGITWTTSDSNVAIVANGVVTAVGPGNATITATTANGKEATCDVTVNGQGLPWTASEVGEGSFVLYNVGTGQYFTRGNGWGTQASITTDASPSSGMTVILEAINGNFKIRTDVNGSGYGVEHLSGGTIYTDQSRNKNTTWTFTQVATDNGPIYNIVSAENHGGGAGAYMTAGIDGTIVTPGTDGTIAGARWKLMSTATLALLSSLDRYQTIKTAAVGIVSNLDTTSPDAAVAAATTVEEIEEAIATLRASFLTALPNVTIPADPGYLDVTNVMLDNAGVHTNTDYWTSYKYPSSPNGGSFAVCNYGECEFYQQNFRFSQTVAMKRGTWEFGVSGFHRGGQGAYQTYFFAGEDQVLLASEVSSVVNSMAEAQTYFNNGNGKVSLKFIIEEDQNIEVGIDNQDTQTDKWTIFRDFTLKYYGPVDYSVYVNQWNDAVTAANNAIADPANANVTGSELTALNTAIADAPDGSSKANYLEKIQALDAATQAFIAAVAAYNAYAAYKAETIALWGTDFDVAAPNAAAEAEDAMHNLNIAQYNKVATDYTFSCTGLIGDFGSWTGTATVAGNAATPNYLDWEHWSGAEHAYYEQAEAGWGNAAGWTIKYEKTCTLPAGSYVIKVAARSSAGVTSTVSCSATETTIALPSAGNSGRGINTSGEASWSNEDTFANTGSYTDHPATLGGSGTGWQWRFLPFTLDEESEVTMIFYAEAKTQYQWMSIADGELLSADKVAEDIVYYEANSNEIAYKLVADVTMNRTIKEGFNTVVLPFTLTANQVAAAFGTGTEVYNYSENSSDPENVTINFTKNDGSITANVPVLIKATAASTKQVFEGVQIAALEGGAEPKVGGNNLDFVGTYAPINSIPAGDYFIGNGALYKSTGSTSINAFRAYLKNKTEGAKVRMFINGDETTGIEGLEIVNTNNGKIYNLNGQEVKNVQKGLYIVNGKKVVMK